MNQRRTRSSSQASSQKGQRWSLIWLSLGFFFFSDLAFVGNFPSRKVHISRPHHRSSAFQDNVIEIRGGALEQVKVLPRHASCGARLGKNRPTHHLSAPWSSGGSWAVSVDIRSFTKSLPRRGGFSLAAAAPGTWVSGRSANMGAAATTCLPSTPPESEFHPLVLIDCLLCVGVF